MWVLKNMDPLWSHLSMVNLGLLILLSWYAPAMTLKGLSSFKLYANNRFTQVANSVPTIFLILFC